MTYNLSYFFMPIPSNLSTIDSVDFLINKFNEVGLTVSVHDRYQGCDLNSFPMITLTAKYGILTRSLNVIFDSKFPSDNRDFARIRLDTSNDFIHQAIESLAIKLDGWIGRNSKQFYLPSTNRQAFLYLAGEQDRETISKDEAIKNIMLNSNDFDADELSCREFEDISLLHLIHAGVEIGFDNSRAYIPVEPSPT